VRFFISFIFYYPINSNCVFKKFSIINNIRAEKSKPELLVGIMLLIGDKKGSVILKTNPVNLFFDGYGNHDINTLKRSI